MSKKCLLSYCLIVENGFNNRGPLTGPSVVMTDNCDELRDALHATWPKAHCYFVYSI